MPLTDTAIRNAKPGPKPTKLYDSGGLYLLINPPGAKQSKPSKLWRFKYRLGGKEKLLAFGAYPDVQLAGRWVDPDKQKRRDKTGYVKGARDLRDEARELLAAGGDPSAERQAKKIAQQIAATNDFESVARAWHAGWKLEHSVRHAAQVLRRLEVDVFPALGKLPVSAIDKKMIVAMLLKMASRGVVETAKRALQKCNDVFRAAETRGLIEHNPAEGIRPKDLFRAKRQVNHARLSERELPELLRKIEQYDGAPITRYALQLMTLTFVRTSELIGMQWSELDLEAKLWRIPAERMKSGRPHIVPLAPQALAVIEKLQEHRNLSEMVFPGERDHDKSMSNNTILYALYRMGYRSRMTGHGFRGIASTILHEQGHRHDLIELQLAHIETNAVSAAYNHATYIPQRTAMMKAWADHLDALRAGGQVVPLRAA